MGIGQGGDGMIVKRRIGQICEHPRDHDKIICNEQGFGQGLIRPIGIITPAYLGLPVLLAQAP
jgi:hypothetical protein